jgi:pimeloyl-ACP methyl ester carboxylesterase
VKKPGDEMQTVVLVHGAWHAAWCWEKLTPELEGLGVLWSAVDLPFTSLEDDAEVLRERLDAIDGEKVVVGHSYGGSVIRRRATAARM